jgi:hypothetical protein
MNSVIKLTLVLVSAVGFTIPVVAAVPDAATITGYMARANSYVASSGEAHIKAQELELQRGRIKELQDSLAGDYSSGRKTPQEIASFTATMNQLNGTIKKIDSELAKLNAQIEPQLNAAINVGNDAEVAARFQLLNVGRKLDQAQMNLIKANAVVSGTKTQIDLIESYYDKTAMGVYLKEKFGLLVNSNLICEAQNRCRVPGKQPIPGESLNPLFPDTAGRRGDSYYNKVQSRDAKGTR